MLYTASEIEALIAQGEGQTVAFEETMPKRLADLATIACSFVNSVGRRAARTRVRKHLLFHCNPASPHGMATVNG